MMRYVDDFGYMLCTLSIAVGYLLVFFTGSAFRGSVWSWFLEED